MVESFRSRTLLFGTLVLTAAGFLSRILGFFYRIFLSRTIGAEGMGIYQMIFPVFGICFSLCAGSIQTAISRFVAADRGKAKTTLLTGFLVSFSLSLVLAGVIWHRADWIAVHILKEIRCAPLLPAMALAIPCTSVHACISGYYYGKEKVQVPAIAQLVEQCIRIFTVFLVTDIWNAQGREITSLIPAIGLLTGEIGSALFSLTVFTIGSAASGKSPGKSSRESSEESSWKPDRHVAGGTLPLHQVLGCFMQTQSSAVVPLLTLAIPLMANRLVMNVLQSAEAILIPQQLTVFGLSDSQALSVYGILTGMAMPFIMFPSAIVNSLAVILLPSVARHQSAGNQSGITKSISISARYSLYMGILCIGIFTVFGETLGTTVFHDAEAGTFITILAWLCPFLYLATTTGSILNGLGKTSVTFLNQLISLTIRLLFVYFGIPRLGILACLWGMLAGEILLAFLHLFALCRQISFSLNVWEVVVKPTFCLLTALGIYRLLPESLPLPDMVPVFGETMLRIGFVCTGYGLLLLLFHRRQSVA